MVNTMYKCKNKLLSMALSQPCSDMSNNTRLQKLKLTAFRLQYISGFTHFNTLIPLNIATVAHGGLNREMTTSQPIYKATKIWKQDLHRNQNFDVMKRIERLREWGEEEWVRTNLNSHSLHYILLVQDINRKNDKDGWWSMFKTKLANDQRPNL